MANMNTNSAMVALTPDQIATLPAPQQAAYMQKLTPDQQALVAAAHQRMLVESNRHYMRKSLEQVAYCPVTGGSGVTAAYSPGTTLYFDFPNVAGFAKALLITYSLTVTPATAGGAAYAVNPAAPYNIFSELQVLYNGAQIRTHPYIIKVLDQLKGYQTGAQNRVLAGNNDSTIAANIVGTTPVVVATGNTWAGKMLLRLNALGEDTCPGVLPLSGVGNKPQLKLTCAPNFMGVDPLQNPVVGTGGSSPSVAVTGNINVDVVFCDGTTMDDPNPLSLQWQGEPTLQYGWDTALTPFSANTRQFQTISSKLQHWYVISLVIDGQQSSSFATLGNLTGFALGPDQVGKQNFKVWNIANNISIYDYFDREMRRPHGQDLDPGVIAWVDAPGRGVINASNRTGQQYLNMYAGGFPAATHSYQVAAVGAVSGITPRVETFLVSINTAGLRVS